MKSLSTALFLASSLFTSLNLQAMQQDAYVSDGVLKWPNGQEVALFGVNYSSPFAFSYRALKKLNIDPKHTIDMDVDHIERMGMDAYRIHIWDRVITDQQGNLLNNEHLELFDYLLMRLAERNITAIITPIAWWGSGYPEADPKEPGFAALYTKAEMNQNPAAIKAQQNYLRQFMAHKNKYTGIAYGEDPNILAFEIFNEPKHPGDNAASGEYIESLIQTIKSVGVTKPLFYNTSEQGDRPKFAETVCNTSIDGVAYQWYPTGLIKYSRLASNLLPSVAEYTNPFKQINACGNKAKMIYEFDAADVTQAVMYPAMARSFRQEGFQWATQFAYDPAPIAHTNADYNTHFLNLLYTPRKAISMLIAGEAFRQLPRGFNAGNYPENNHFSDFSISYKDNLSILNQAKKLIYTATNQAKPKANQALTQVAGVGSSEVVKYQGTGAYFFDKVSDGVWLLEVYPDAQKIQDPHQNSSLRREVVRLYSGMREFELKLDNLGKQFYVKGFNQDNQFKQKAKQGKFSVLPGKYLLSKSSMSSTELAQIAQNQDNQFYLPAKVSEKITLDHQAQREWTLSDDIQFKVNIGAIEQADQVELMVRYRGHSHFTPMTMEHVEANQYQVSLPKSDSWKLTGDLEYAFTVKTNGQFYTFPGGVQGSPTDWDFVDQGYYQSKLKPENAILVLFDAEKDQNTRLYPKWGKTRWDYVAGQNGLGTAFRLSIMDLEQSGSNWLLRSTLAEDNHFSAKNLSGYNTLAIKARAIGDTDEFVNIAVLNQDGLAFGKTIQVGQNWQFYQISIADLTSVKTMMTNGYPMFLPAEYPSLKQADVLLNLNQIQGSQVSFDASKYSSQALKGWHAVELEYMYLIKK
ncbi:family 1 glycosylhydrolase [Catenovulum maritimum]|uniref:Uncharacterized protein n=1 Tax=Catenovulum maritimum TaxID=1513271 RepID=A0A0J8JPT4_9ALTE|nr:family 1 glycosylhydrolase [Catenovulum maritimum]KMT66686.1 hypothetical protein XM47_00710 [Catenovulum maritimum]